MHLVQFGQQNLSGLWQEQHLAMVCILTIWMCINRTQSPGKLLLNTSIIPTTRPESVLTDTSKVKTHHTAISEYYS